MDYQPSLFDRPEPAPPHNSTPTSRAAAESIKPTAGTLRALVLDFLKACSDGATDEQMQQALNMAGNTQRPRRQELETMGLIRKTDKTRATSSGRQAVIWEAT
jgi:hypothetical protein